MMAGDLADNLADGIASVQHIALPTGQLQLQVKQSRWPQDELLGFGARDNLKRGFLFVSKVLGKHWPVTPQQMAALHHDLAQNIPATLPGPILFIALAETAIGLGQGVFEAFLQLQADAAPAAMFLHSTRYRANSGELIEFSEPHSHAPRQFLHLPETSALRQLMQQARTLVLIDDEASTGNTFVNLVQTLRPYCPHLAQVHITLITDFSGPEARLAERIGLPTTVDATLAGQYQFIADSSAASGANSVANSVANSTSPGHTTVSANPRPAQRFADQPNPAASSAFGRTGLARALHPSAIRQLAASLAEQIAPDETVLLLGTGEFMHPAFLLAQALANHARQVSVQATTRSPILQWGAIGHRFCFDDNYGEGIANYLYNAVPGQYRHVLICHETPPGPGLLQLAQQLQARLFQFHSEDRIEEVFVR